MQAPPTDSGEGTGAGGGKRGKEAMRLPKSKDCSRQTDCLMRKSINIDLNAVTTGGVYVSWTAHCTKPI